MKSFSVSMMLILFSLPAQASNPLKLPLWSDSEKYGSKTAQTVPLRKRDFSAFAGLNYGFKNGFGVDAMACKKLSRYLCGGARIFLGSLKSEAIVRSPTPLESLDSQSELATVLVTPESWFAFVPEVGLTVNTQIIPLAAQGWSESAWFGFGKAFIGGRSGWAISFEPGISKKFKMDEDFGWTLRAKYTFGWLYSKSGIPGTIPYDWFNLTAGLFYAW